MRIPKKLEIANLPTPIQKHEYNGCKFLIKRDDFTGLEFSGNKIRKLEYLLYEAKKQKADYVFTMGGEQSNHCRATAFAAVGQGMQPRIFLWGKDSKVSDGNLFLDKVIGTELEFFAKKDFNAMTQAMEDQKNELAEKGKIAFIIPEGGSSTLGLWGYVNFMKELYEQTGMRGIKGVISAAGSGGTAAGLLIGSALLGLNIKIFGVNVVFTETEFKEKILALAEEAISIYKLNIKINPANLEIIEGYSLEGYKKIDPQKISIIKDFARQTGIIFDPAYTGKTFFAYNDLFLNGKKNSNILMIHTGGLFGTFSKRKEYLEAK